MSCVHKFIMRVESLAPLGTPGQRFFASACPTATSSRSPPQIPTPAESRRARAGLAAAYPTMVFAETEPGPHHDVDVVFWACPRQSQKLVPQLLERNVSVVDLGADFRFEDKEDYREW